MLDLLIGLIFIVVTAIAAVITYRLGLGNRSKVPGILATVVFTGSLWFPLTYLQKLVSWVVWGGRGFALGYGGDKTLTNLVLEIPLVCLSTAGVYLATRFVLGNRFTRRIAIAIAWIVALAVVAIIPALPE